MTTYKEEFAKCKTMDELADLYEDLLDACTDLSEIKNIDAAYVEEFEKRKKEI